jgi:hypothetical protein
MQALSRSDWIAIAGIVITVIVAIGMGALQIRATNQTRNAPKEIQPKALQTSNARWFFKNTWSAILGVGLSALLLWQTLADSDPPTRGTIFSVTLLSWWFMICVVLIAGYAAAASVREPYEQLRKQLNASTQAND